MDEPLLREIAREHDATAVQIALAWLLQKERVLPIPKATGREHLEENFAALEIDLSPEQMQRIDGLDRRVRAVDPSFAAWR